MNSILPEPQSIQAAGWLCLSVFGMAGGIDSLLKIWDRCKESPPPAQTYVNKEDCRQIRLDILRRLERLETELALMRAEMKNDRDALLKAGENRAQKLHDRIDALLARLDIHR